MLFLGHPILILDIGSGLFTGVENTTLVLFGLIFIQLCSTRSFRRETMVLAVVIIL